MNKKVAVVIPNYRESLTSNEKISLEQVKRILRQYDIFFLLPNSLRINYGCSEISEKRYSDKYFLSRRMYSRFMLSPELYKDFENYDYILVYQLDAFVFEDQLAYFCDLGYDYIGAPWIDGIYFKKDEKEKMWHVGNGGFSLRRVKPFLKWTEQQSFEQYIDFINEDLLIAAYGGPLLNIAPVNVALSFSFETNCSRCLELTGGKLPFGCHAWEKYEFEFWKPLIEKQGYATEVVLPKEFNVVDQIRGMNDFFNQPNSNRISAKLPYTYNKDKGIYIWGVGQCGISLMHKLVESGILVDGFIDNDTSKCGKKVLSYKIVRASSLVCKRKPIIVAVQNNFFQVEKQLQEYGYLKNMDYIVLQDIVSNMAE